VSIRSKKEQRRLIGKQRSDLPPTREAALIEELAQDLADCYNALLASGASEPEAYQQTLAELTGSEPLSCELQREAGKQEPILPETNRRENMLADFWRDLRYGARTLGKNKGFTFVAVSSLALGFTLVATTLAVVNAYLIRSMPFPAAGPAVSRHLYRAGRAGTARRGDA
jgi:hypothetical protein